MVINESDNNGELVNRKIKYSNMMTLEIVILYFTAISAPALLKKLGFFSKIFVW